VNLGDALKQIQAEAGFTDPAQVALVARVTMDAGQLQARAMAGEDVASELDVVAATAANLSEHVRNVIGRHLLTAATNVLARALGVAIAAA
jgi:hypothetical protein